MIRKFDPRKDIDILLDKVFAKHDVDSNGRFSKM